MRLSLSQDEIRQAIVDYLDKKTNYHYTSSLNPIDCEFSIIAAATCKIGDMVVYEDIEASIDIS